MGKTPNVVAGWKSGYMEITGCAGSVLQTFPWISHLPPSLSRQIFSPGACQRSQNIPWASDVPLREALIRQTLRGWWLGRDGDSCEAESPQEPGEPSLSCWNSAAKCQGSFPKGFVHIWLFGGFWERSQPWENPLNPKKTLLVLGSPLEVFPNKNLFLSGEIWLWEHSPAPCLPFPSSLGIPWVGAAFLGFKTSAWPRSELPQTWILPVVGSESEEKAPAAIPEASQLLFLGKRSFSFHPLPVPYPFFRDDIRIISIKSGSELFLWNLGFRECFGVGGTLNLLQFHGRATFHHPSLLQHSRNTPGMGISQLFWDILYFSLTESTFGLVWAFTSMDPSRILAWINWVWKHSWIPYPELIGNELHRINWKFIQEASAMSRARKNSWNVHLPLP